MRAPDNKKSKLRGVALWCALLSAWILLLSPAWADDKEFLIKAGFITKFPSFVTWPENGVTNHQSRFTYCALGNSPILRYIQSLTVLAMRPADLERIQSVGEAAEPGRCNVLFIAGDYAAHIGSVVDELASRPVLLIGDTPGYAERGVHINLYRSGSRVKFEINRSALGMSGLQVSFRLLEMARVID